MSGSIAINVTAGGEITVEPKNPVITVSAPTAAVTVQSGGVPGPSGPEGAQGPPGDAYLSARWNFNQNTAAPPASGTIRMNATTYAAVTLLWVSEEDRDNLDRQAGLDQITVGSQIIMQSPQGRAVWSVASIVDSGTYRTIGVTLVESTGNRPNGGAATTLYITATRAADGVPAGGTTGQVLVKESVADYDTTWADATGGAIPRQIVSFPVPSATWVVDVGRPVDVVVINSAGQVVWPGEIVYGTGTQITLTFSASFSGEVHCYS